MSERVSYFRLGIFVLVGLALIVAALVVLGAGAWLKKTIPVETYIEGSVQGLEVGAPVKYLGVHIGKVSWIGFVFEKYHVDTTEDLIKYGKYVMVRVKLDPDTMPKLPNKERMELLDDRIKAGLRVHLMSSLTGPTYLEADYVDPNKYPPLKTPWTPEVEYVPSCRAPWNKSSARSKRWPKKLRMPRSAS